MKPIAALLFILLPAPIAHADNTNDQKICQQSQDFGLSPGQIADNLHNGQCLASRLDHRMPAKPLDC